MANLNAVVLVYHNDIVKLTALGSNPQLLNFPSGSDEVVPRFFGEVGKVDGVGEDSAGFGFVEVGVVGPHVALDFLLRSEVTSAHSEEGGIRVYFTGKLDTQFFYFETVAV